MPLTETMGRYFGRYFGTPPSVRVSRSTFAGPVPRCRPLVRAVDFRAVPALPLTLPAVTRCAHSIDLPPERRGRVR